MDNGFMKLVEKYGGFEYILGFRDDEDHFIGGSGNRVWYFITKGRAQECFTGEWKDGAWTDRHILKKKTLKEESAAPGKTIGMILSRAYFGQEEITSSGRRPAAVRLCDRPCSHYAFSFGARAYDISDEFGVTFSYSDIDDERAGWRLRNVFTGSQVKPPEMG